jgi:hypothetical protein
MFLCVFPVGVRPRYSVGQVFGNSIEVLLLQSTAAARAMSAAASRVIFQMLVILLQEAVGRTRTFVICA